MTVFEGQLLAHPLGGWILQTEWQAQNKETNWAALMIHVLVYPAIVLLMLIFGFGLSGLPTYIVVGCQAVIHTVMDRRTLVLRFMRVLRITVHRTPERWLILAVDQSLHLLTLGGAAYILTTLR